MVIGILVIITFLVFAALIAFRKIPAMYALPMMAIVIAVLARMPFMGETSIIDTVVVGGTSYLQGTVFLILVACWLSQVMYNTGVTNTIIKKAAELGGDKPVIITTLLLIACIFIFTSLFGTGAAMMVGTIVLPILLSIGVPPVKAANFFLSTMAIGFGINVPNMAPILAITGNEPRDLIGAGIVIMITGSMLLGWQMWTVFRKDARKFAFAAEVTESSEEPLYETQKTVKGIRGLLACLTPIVIVVLTYFFNIAPLACFYIGVIWIIAMTFDGNYKKYVNMLTTSFYDGTKDAGPPLAICIGIGMVLRAMTFQGTQDALLPIISRIIPSGAIAMAVFMVVLAPLNLYRGPLSIYGLGSGLMAVMLTAGSLPATALAALFLTQMRWSNEACPTGTVTVWSSNFVGSDPVTVANKVFIPNWVVQAVALTIVTFMYM